jgi:MoxR-like ATPase
MANDDALVEVLTELAASSGRQLTFRSMTAAEVREQLAVPVSRSSNRIYIFDLTNEYGAPLRCVAFTLSLNASSRPATRAEALGKSLAQDEGRLFDFNPLLLINDFGGDRVMAVAATELFGAFARYAADHEIPTSGSAMFSLSPNFEHGSISMYAEVRSPVVWQASTARGALSLEDLVGFLRRVARETHEAADQRPATVAAIQARLEGTPAHRTVSVVPALDVDYAQVDEADEDVRVDPRVWRMILDAIASSAGVILVGPPGTGKSALLRKAIGVISEQRVARGLPGLKPPLWATPDESWTARELIGGETVDRGDIVFRPGWVLRAIAEDRWLVLDEANRGDLDRIFGALLTWMARGQVVVGMESAGASARPIELGWTNGPSGRSEVESSETSGQGAVLYLANERDWKLLGTYNALDAQRVFRLGAALGRRFVRVPVPPVAPDEFDDILDEKAPDLPSSIRTSIKRLYLAHHFSDATTLGPAMFLSMCSYIRVAKQRGPDDLGSDASDSADSSSRGETETAQLADVVPLAPPPVSEDRIVSEAYVLHAGTSLAQLEEPDLNTLMSRIQASAALTLDGITWVKSMLRSLA